MIHSTGDVVEVDRCVAVTVNRVSCSATSTLRLGRVGFNRATAAYLLGRPEEALGMVDDLLLAHEAVSGPKHPNTLTTRYLRAQILDGLGRYGEALAAVDAVLPVQNTVSGPKHPNTLATRNLRARVLAELSRAEEALTAVDDLLPIQEAVSGPADPDELVLG